LVAGMLIGSSFGKFRQNAAQEAARRICNHVVKHAELPPISVSVGIAT
jgi:hypothetical protein